MTNTILFVFEGANTEKQIADNLKKHSLIELPNVTCAYCNDIYELYKEVRADQDLDIFVLLKEISLNQEVLSPFKSSDIGEIYLFFDYDGHDEQADDSKLNQMLHFFNEETSSGKLYLSYPMVEALKHIPPNTSDFKDLKVEAKQSIGYKEIVGSEGKPEFKNLTTLTFDNWKELIELHLKKMNFIVNKRFEFPQYLAYQSEIFEHQLQNYINKDETVAVLSAFPIFLFEYYGPRTIKSILQ